MVRRRRSHSERIHQVEKAEAMELFNDWGKRKRVPPEPSPKGAVSPPEPLRKRAASASPASVEGILEALAKFEKDILNVHCYEDVGYPWVQVVFDKIISPDVALDVGDALAAVAGAEHVYFNSLRPRAVYFILEPAFDDPRPDFPASRYGAPLKDIRKSWAQSA
jgi:hypothetical protein